MRAEDIHNLGVIGAGTMGHGIALSYALHGYRVRLHDRSDLILSRALSQIRHDLATFAECGLISEDVIPRTLENILATTDLKVAAENADFVTEVVTEDVGIKRSIFKDLDRFCPQHTILASNTSSLRLAEFSSECQRRDRILITHWINPPHIVPAVEVVGSEVTSAESLDLACALLKLAGKIPVRLTREVPGLVHNRILHGMIREAWALWAEGIASAEDIDLTVQAGFGFRLSATGPLESCDLGGLDTWYRVAEELFPEISDAHSPPEKLKEMVAEGKLGLKSGQGFFTYTSGGEGQDSRVRERDKKLVTMLRLLYPGQVMGSGAGSAFKTP